MSDKKFQSIIEYRNLFPPLLDYSNFVGYKITLFDKIVERIMNGDDLFNKNKNHKFTINKIKHLTQCLGYSLEKLNNIIFFAEFNEDLASLLNYKEWMNKKGLENGLIQDTKRNGIINFLLNAAKYQSIIDIDHDIIQCNKENLNRFYQSPPEIKFRLIKKFVDGEYNSIHGNLQDLLFRKLCHNLKIKCSNGSKQIKGIEHSWDLHILDKNDNDIIIGETACYNASGSAITRKITGLGISIKNFRKINPNVKFIYIGGGIAFMRRKKDARDLANMMDDCFSYSHKGSKEFVNFLFETLNLDKLSEADVDEIIDQTFNNLRLESNKIYAIEQNL